MGQTYHKVMATYLLQGYKASKLEGYTTRLRAQPSTDLTTSSTPSPPHKVHRSPSANLKQQGFSKAAIPLQFPLRAAVQRIGSLRKTRGEDGRPAAPPVPASLPPAWGGKRIPSPLSKLQPHHQHQQSKKSLLLEREASTQNGSHPNRARGKQSLLGFCVPSTCTKNLRQASVQPLQAWRLYPKQLSTAPQRVPRTSPSAHNISSSGGAPDLTKPSGPSKGNCPCWVVGASRQ
ncbi:hypothetical protein CB1_056579066 [Camelus ferus]|nr:hypothetical protein CB1_056579066 [Camelus ferus]